VSPHGVEYETSTRVEFECMNNQIEYEALLNGLKALHDMGADNVEIYGDSKQVVEQMNGTSQCLDGVLNEYSEACMDLLRRFKRCSAEHVPREENRGQTSWSSRRLGVMLNVASF
jgi:ribonuclease HI